MKHAMSALVKALLNARNVRKGTTSEMDLVSLDVPLVTSSQTKLAKNVMKHAMSAMAPVILIAANALKATYCNQMMVLVAKAVLQITSNK